MTEETIAGTPATDETELLPPTTQAAIPLAWSDVVDDDDAGSGWGRTAMAATLFILAAATIAVAILGAFMVFQRSDNPASAPPTSPAPASTIPAAALPPISTPPPPPPAASPPASTESAPDPNAPPRPLEFDSRGIPIIPKNPTPLELRNVIVAIFDHDGIPYDGPIGAEADAESVCAYLSNGHHGFLDVIDWVQRTNPGLPRLKADGLVGASIGTYCRQYGYLLNDDSGTATS